MARVMTWTETDSVRASASSEQVWLKFGLDVSVMLSVEQWSVLKAKADAAIADPKEPVRRGAAA